MIISNRVMIGENSSNQQDYLILHRTKLKIVVKVQSLIIYWIRIIKMKIKNNQLNK